jgi:Nuclease-related domain
MAGNRHDEDRVCLCERPDGTCAGLAVRRLSHDRVRELAEEIWTASSGYLLPARPVLDPRSSRPGAAAMAAYRRRRRHEREAWCHGWRRRAWVILGAAATGGLVIGSAFGERLAWLMTLLAAALAWWRLRFRPSAGATIWRRQAVTQRRTAGMLEPLAAEGWLVLHDVVLPGWLDSLDHVVAGPTGVWVVESWRRSRLLPVGRGRPGFGDQLDRLRGLTRQAEAVAESLDRGGPVPVRPLLCAHSWWRGPRSVAGARVRIATPRQLATVVRCGATLAPADVEPAITRLLEVLRPAA